MADNVKRIDPMAGVLSTTRAIATGNNEHRRDVFREETDEYTVDTCVGFDTGMWETGIKPQNGDWVIVEQYASRDEAKTGHDKWVQIMRENPNRELKDINLWGA